MRRFRSFLFAILLASCFNGGGDSIATDNPQSHPTTSNSSLIFDFDLPPYTEEFLRSQKLDDDQRSNQNEWIQRSGKWLLKSGTQDCAEVSTVAVHMTYIGDCRAMSHSVDFEPEAKDLTKVISNRQMFTLTLVPSEGKHVFLVSGTVISSTKDHRQLHDCRRVFELQNYQWIETTSSCNSILLQDKSPTK